MISLLINVMFASRDAAHRAHLTTTSYAAHVALAEFYTGIVDRADAIAEAWMGRNGAIKSLPDSYVVSASDIAKTLEMHLEVIEEARNKEMKQDAPIQNLIDEACDLYLSTLYKLRQFK